MIPAGIISVLVVILIILVVCGLRRLPLSLNKFRTPFEQTLGDLVSPLHASVGSLALTRLNRTGAEITIEDVRLCSDTGFEWVHFGRITCVTPLRALLFPHRFSLDGPWLFSETSVDAVEPQPQFEALHGIASMTGEALRFDVAGGSWGNINVTRGTVVLNHPAKEGVHADISFQCNATALDALQTVTTAPLDVIKATSLESSGIEGTVEADVQLAFHFDDLPHIEYSTRAHIRGLGLPSLFGGLDLGYGQFDVAVSHASSTIEGTARLGGAPSIVRYSKTTSSGPETWTIEMDDLGALHAIPARFTGGKLHATITRHDDEEPWLGRIDLRRLHIVHAPLLARLLTMASLSGLLSTLTNDGLMIDHGHTEISLETGLIRCSSTRISIDQLEITGDIEIQLENGHIEGEGLLIPAATLQRLVGAVPVVGAFLEGLGLKNSAIVATRFTVSGPSTAPEIIVFPLSSLAPEILKEIGLS